MRGGMLVIAWYSIFLLISATGMTGLNKLSTEAIRAFMAPEPDDDDDETWVLFNAMNGNRAEMSPEAAGIAACLMTYSHHACRTENYAMTVHYYRLRDYALQHPECSAIMRIIDYLNMGFEGQLDENVRFRALKPLLSHHSGDSQTLFG